MLKIYLKHLLNVVILRLEQLAPGGQVAVGQDPTGLQQPVSVTLQTKRDATPTQPGFRSCQHMAERRHNTNGLMCESNQFPQRPPALMWTTYLNEVKLVSVPFFL